MDNEEWHKWKINISYITCADSSRIKKQIDEFERYKNASNNQKKFKS